MVRNLHKTFFVAHRIDSLKIKIGRVMSQSGLFGSQLHHRYVQDYIEKMNFTRGVAPIGTKWHQLAPISEEVTGVEIKIKVFPT